MAWSYNILSKGADSDGVVIVEVQFQSDVGPSYTFNKLFRPSSLDDLKVGISNTLTRQASFDNQTSTIPATGTLTDLTPTPTPTPTAAIANRTAFVADWQRLKAADAWVAKYGPLTSLPAAQQTYYNNLKARTQTEGNQVIADFGADAFFLLII